jgi:ABC-type molybdate transport system ATPase subunit
MIMLVPHDNRILDVADRIMHMEDGKISTFTDAVIANTQHMMHALAENRQKQPLESVVDEMDEESFRLSLTELTQQSQHFL